MGCFSYKHLVSYSTIIAFISSSITPTLNASIHEGYSCNVINLAFVGVKLEKLIEKMNKYKDQGNSDKLMDCMFDIKHEVEHYLGKSVSIDSVFSDIEKNLKNKGHKLDKNQIKSFKNTLHKKEKKHNHKIQFMAQYIEMGIDYDPYLAELDFQAKHKHEKDDKDKEEKGEVVVPLNLAIGITCCLCGGFLCFIPLPTCQTVGIGVFSYGIQKIVDEMYINPLLEEHKK